MRVRVRVRTVAIPLAQLPPARRRATHRADALVDLAVPLDLLEERHLVRVRVRVRVRIRVRVSFHARSS